MKKKEKKVSSTVNIFNPCSDNIEDTYKNLILINPNCFLVVDQQTNLGLWRFFPLNDSIETKEHPTFFS